MSNEFVDRFRRVVECVLCCDHVILAGHKCAGGVLAVLIGGAAQDACGEFRLGGRIGRGEDTERAETGLSVLQHAVLLSDSDRL